MKIIWDECYKKVNDNTQEGTYIIKLNTKTKKHPEGKNANQEEKYYNIAMKWI